MTACGAVYRQPVLLGLQALALASTAGAQPAPAPTQDRQGAFVTPQDFGAACNNSTDDGAALQAALDYAGRHGKALHLPRCSYAIGRRIVVSMPTDITADPSSNLRFTDPSSCGIMVDLRSSAANFGLNSIQLGGIYAPAVDRTFKFRGYPKNWSASDRAVCDGMTLVGGSRMDVFIKYVEGFRAGVSIEATHDDENGARAPNNVNLTINTADILEYGIRIAGGPAQAGTLAAINVEINTVFARYPVYFDTTHNKIGQVTVHVAGQAFTNEPGGACVYGVGSGVSTSSIDILWCYAGYSPVDSPRGTPLDLQLPYLAGSGTSNSLLKDGNAAAGYWTSSNNRISIGVASDQPASPGGYANGAEKMVRVRDAGANELRFPFVPSPEVAVALSRRSGEPLFGNGIAGLSRTLLVHVNIPRLEPGASATFYAYGSTLSPASSQVISVIPKDVLPAGLAILAQDDAASANRQMRVLARNASAIPTHAWSGDIWLKIR